MKKVDFSELEKLEKEQNAVRKANETHLKNFEEWLKNQGLTNKTVRNHLVNVEFYINDFLCYYDALDVKHGCYKISNFLGDWFIRKAMWSSGAQIKTNAASIKKFYAFMLEIGVVEQKDYDELTETIKEEMPDWLDEMEQYDNMLDDDF